MEIERKFTIKELPKNLEQYEHHEITQAYILNSDPVLRIRQLDDDYILTYKSKGMMTRVEEEMSLNKEAFEKLLSKTEGNVISKTRYKIPEANGLVIELDLFHGAFEGLNLAEVEFTSEEEANAYKAPEWFNEDVTFAGSYHNSRMSMLTEEEIIDLVNQSKHN
jgi:CYTH domain-containing protein